MRMSYHRTTLTALLGMLLFGSPTKAAETAKQKEEIQKAVTKGVDYLLKVHQPSPNYTGGSKKVGTACLAGMALLESGVDEKNPSLENIIQFVRAGCLQQTGTYEVSLCLMFLDRLGQPEERAQAHRWQPYVCARRASGEARRAGVPLRTGPGRQDSRTRRSREDRHPASQAGARTPDYLRQRWDAAERAALAVGAV